MAFGKRRGGVGLGMQRPGQPPNSPAQATRFANMSETMMGIFETTSRIAIAVREQTSIRMPPVLEVPDPETGPIDITGFSLHFVVIDGGRITHRTFGYQRPDASLSIDPNAQFHLHQLMGRILDFNIFCQQADLDEALKVALQAPIVKPTLDSILAASAFFAAMFETMAGASAGGIMVDWDDQGGSMPPLFERNLLMASDRMFVSDNLDKLLPYNSGPFHGVELTAEPHSGDHFLNGVYFPAEHARLLLDETAAASAA